MMDESLRRMIDDACRESDRLKAEFECDEWRRAQRAKRSMPAGVDYDEWMASRPKPKPTQHPQQTGMDKATSDAWNKWMTDYVGKAIGANNKALVKALGEGIVEFVCEYVHKHLETETKKLRDEIAGLRTDMVVGRSVLRGEINELRETGMKKKVRT